MIGPRLVVSFLALLLTGTQPVQACRCTERPLADYYNLADQVFAARMVRISPAGDHRRLVVEVLGQAWKGALRAGQEMELETGASSASCALDPEADQIWLLFVAKDSPLLTSCAGSRELLAQGDHQPSGFLDVPAKHVAGQLNALAGLDALAALARSSEPRLIGLLDIKALAHGGSVPVLADDNPGARVIASVADLTDLKNREVSYESAAAEVYDIAEFGYRVRLADGRFGWLAKEHAGTWFPYADLIVNRLNYMTPQWHGFLWPHLGAGLPVRAPRIANGATGPGANVVGVEWLAGSLWLRVEILASDGCDGLEPRVLAVGWTPAWTVSGVPAAWYHSRGC